MGKIAFIFPGQGSQHVGMGKAIFDVSEAAKEVFALADRVINEPLSQLCFNGPEDTLKLTENTQPAILTTSIALYQSFKDKGIEVAYMAGHSLGEYSALVAAGALSIEEGIKIVRLRGQLMEKAVPAGEGAMSAVLGFGREELAQVCNEVTVQGDPVQNANLNCPGQIVISGSKKGVERAGILAKERGAKRVLPLPVSGPFHSSLMQPAAERLREQLELLKWHEPSVPIISNVDALPAQSIPQLKDNLYAQVTSSVLWEDSVHWMIEQGVDIFVEIGPSNVLSGLVKKINKEVKTLSIQDPQTLEEALNHLLTRV